MSEAHDILSIDRAEYYRLFAEKLTNCFGNGLSKADKARMSYVLRPTRDGDERAPFELTLKYTYEVPAGGKFIATIVAAQDLSGTDGFSLLFLSGGTDTPADSAYVPLSGLTALQTLSAAGLIQGFDIDSASIKARADGAATTVTGRFFGGSRSNILHNGAAFTDYVDTKQLAQEDSMQAALGMTARRDSPMGVVDDTPPSARDTFHATSGAQCTEEMPFILGDGLTATQEFSFKVVVRGSIKISESSTYQPLIVSPIPDPYLEVALARKHRDAPFVVKGNSFKAIGAVAWDAAVSAAMPLLTAAFGPIGTVAGAAGGAVGTAVLSSKPRKKKKQPKRKQKARKR
jgi:hypothetical protein